MTAKIHEDLHNSYVALVYTDVQRRLTALVASIQVGTATVKHTDHFRLVTKCRMMDGSVTIFVLHNTNKHLLPASLSLSIGFYLNHHFSRKRLGIAEAIFYKPDALPGQQCQSTVCRSMNELISKCECSNVTNPSLHIST